MSQNVTSVLACVSILTVCWYHHMAAKRRRSIIFLHTCIFSHSHLQPNPEEAIIQLRLLKFELFKNLISMGKLSQYARNRIISLHKASNSIVNIVKILEKDGIKTSQNSVSSFIARYKRTGSIDDAQRSGRKAILCENDRNFNNSYMLIF